MLEVLRQDLLTELIHPLYDERITLLIPTHNLLIDSVLDKS